MGRKPKNPRVYRPLELALSRHDLIIRHMSIPVSQFHNHLISIDDMYKLVEKVDISTLITSYASA